MRGDLHIGMLIRDVRTIHRLRQGEVAQRADLSRSTLSEVERGWREPNQDQLRAILRAIYDEPRAAHQRGTAR